MSKKKSDLNRGNSRKSTRGNSCHPEAQTVMDSFIPKYERSRKTLCLVAPEAITIQDAIDKLLADPEVSQVRRRDLASSLRRVASAIGLPPTQVPADLQWIRLKLAGQSDVPSRPKRQNQSQHLIQRSRSISARWLSRTSTGNPSFRHLGQALAAPDAIGKNCPRQLYPLLLLLSDRARRCV